MGAAGSKIEKAGEAVRITNPGGRSPYVIVCDHASNYVPAEFGTFGLPASDLERHIAWDPGALPVASMLAAALDATLVYSGISRLVIDCNRPLDAGNLFWTVSEGTVIPGNANLDETQRLDRIELAYAPFHDAIDSIVSQRVSAGREVRVVSIHSFTPVYLGVQRPWEIGVIYDADERLGAPMVNALRAEGELTVGVNEPYSPADKVYFTLEKHARSRGLPCAMIEIRNDEIADEASQRVWAERLAAILRSLPDKISVEDKTPVRGAGAKASIRLVK